MFSILMGSQIITVVVIFTSLLLLLLLSSCPAQGTGFCAPNVQNITNRGIFNWTETVVGSIANTSCFYGPPQEIATRKCNLNKTWAPPSVSLCRTKISGSFHQLNQMNISVENVNSVLNNVTELVTSADPMVDHSIENLRMVTDLLSQSAMVIQSENVSLEVISNATTGALVILDRVKEWPNEFVEQHSNRIVQALETKIGTLIAHEEYSNISVVRGDLGLHGERIGIGQFSGRLLSVIGRTASQPLKLMTTDAAHVDELPTHFHSAFSLPREIASHVPDEDAHVSIAYTVYNSPELFPVRNTSQISNSSTNTTTVGSQVVSVSVAGIKDGTVLSAPVKFFLRLTNDIDLEVDEYIGDRRCVFWDFAAANGNGDWSTNGCHMTDYNSTTNIISCECNHLTNFACLVDISIRISDKPERQIPRELTLALEITSYVGVSFSLVGLIVLILTHIVFKKLRQKDVTKFHVQLAMSMILFLVVFVAGINRTENRAGCITVGVLLHYLILVTWMWMGAEAVIIFQKLVLVFKQTTTIFIIIVSLVCWVAPLLPVIISVSIDRSYYITVSNKTRDFCFISNPGVFFGAFLGPIFLVIFWNTCIFICAAYVICKLKLKRLKNKTARQKEDEGSSKEACKLLTTLIGFMILLGISWIILLFTIVGVDTNIYAAFAIQWLFVFFNSLQGFFICIFFVVISSDARKEWAKLLAPCWFKKKYRPSFKVKQTSTCTTSAGYSRNSTNNQSTIGGKESEMSNNFSITKDAGGSSIGQTEVVVDPVASSNDAEAVTKAHDNSDL